MDKHSQFSRNMNTVCDELRQEGKFCDAIIKVEDSEFEVHKVILCCCTPYFRALFTRWAEDEKRVFDIPGVDAYSMSLIIEYAYTGSVAVTEGNVLRLLLAADQLNVMDIVQTCCDFVEKTLSPSNCIEIWQFTDICYQPELRSKAYHYIIEHFEEVPHNNLLQLPVDELCAIIDRDDLAVRHEITVCEAVMKWISNSSQENQRYIYALFSKIRLVLLGEDYIRTNLLSNDLIKSNPECMTLITNAMRIISAMDTFNLPFPSISNPLCRPRLPSGILLAVGGWSGGDPTNGIEAYDIRADSWINVTDNQERPRAYHGVAFLNGFLYCVGGFDRMEHFNSMRRFDLRTHIWSEVAPMYFRRCYVSVTVLNGRIYAMGGYDGHSRLNTAEYYQPETNQWNTIARMHEQRSDASCTAFNDRIYICGGFNGQECLQTAESYNPETNQWTMISPMNSRRSGVGVIAYADRIYAVGGFDGNSRLRTAEAYNPRTDTWENVAYMHNPRSNFGIEVIEDKLFAVGGFNGATTSFNVEYYDAMVDEWTEACDMEIFRSALSCCVLSGLPNMADYSVSRDIVPHIQFDEEEMESGDDS